METRTRTQDLPFVMPSRKLAWSKSSTIAHITSHGQAVEIQALALSADGTTSVLSEPSSLEFPPLAPHTVLTHIAWSNYGSDLAVVDSTGRTSLFSPIVVANRLLLAGAFDPDPDDQLGTIVGLEWFTVNRMV